jgi:hypothetical protein
MELREKGMKAWSGFIRFKIWSRGTGFISLESN